MQGQIVKVIEKNNVEYRCLDFLQSTGTQYFNLGNFSFNANTDVIETKFKYDAISTGSSAYWLYSSQDSSAQYVHDFYTQNNSFYTRVGLRAASYPFSQDTNIHTLKVDYVNGIIYLDNAIKYSGIEKSSLSNMPFRLLARTTSTGDYTKARIYNFTITRSGTKILDLIPVERVSDNAIGLLDLISGTLYTNAGSGTFGKSYQQVEHIYKPNLKAKIYEKLEYIQSTGTQYINLGNINVDKDTQVEIVIDNLGNEQHQFGILDSANNKGISYQSSQNIGAYNRFGYFTTTNLSVANNGKHTYKLNSTAYYLDNAVKVNVSTTDFTLNQDFYILKANGSSNTPAIAKLYGFKVWNGTVLKLDLIPVKRLKDNAIGLLDTLTNTFYANSGTGAFTGQSLSTPEYIEEDVEQVDYIEKNADGPYIDLNITSHNGRNYGYECDVYVLRKDNNTWPAFYGSVNGGDYDNGSYGFYLHNSDNQVSGRAGNGNGQIGNHSATTLLNNWCNVKYNRVNTSQELTINGNKQTRTGGNNGYTNIKPFLFGINNNSGLGFDFQARIRNFKAYENGALVRDCIAVKYGTEYCMLDLVDMKLYHNKGTGNFTGGNKVEVQKITQVYFHNNTKYFPLDYIQSSGTQYITTNIKPNGNERFELEFTPLEWSSSTNNTVCGARKGANGIMVFGSILEAYGGGSRLANFTYNANFSKMTLNVKHKVRYERDKMWYDGTQYTATGRQLIDVGYNMTIFASSNDGTIAGHTKMKLHSFKVFNDDLSIKEHWLPMQRASDNVLGLLDIISGDFKTNSGSGTFTGNKREITF